MSRDRIVRRHRVAAAAVSGLAVVALSACGGGAGSAGPTGKVRGAAVLVGRIEPLHAGSLTAAQVARDDAAFGFALFAKLCTSQPTANLTISPASAAQALGMLDAGSVGATRAQVAHLLDLPVWNDSLIAALHDQATALGRISQVKVSNHVFEQTGLSPTRQTLDDLKTAYNADLRQLDFSKEPASTDAINAVIDHDTDHLIPKLFDDSLDAATQTVLANAVLLDAKWDQPFPTSAPGTFHTAAGNPVTAPLMQNAEGSFASRSAGGWQSVVLPYQGGKLQAVAMLPPVGDSDSASVGDSGRPPSAATCPTPSPSTLSALTSGASTSVGVVLPKLDLSQTLPLTKTLADMGLPITGDYTGLGQADNQISEVVQKVVMKVDKQGTKAAAATGIGMTTSARVVKQVVTFNRSFLLLLEDTATKTPLFLTRVADPTAG